MANRPSPPTPPDPIKASEVWAVTFSLAINPVTHKRKEPIMRFGIMSLIITLVVVFGHYITLHKHSVTDAEIEAQFVGEFLPGYDGYHSNFGTVVPVTLPAATTDMVFRNYMNVYGTECAQDGRDNGYVRFAYRNRSLLLMVADTSVTVACSHE